MSLKYTTVSCVQCESEKVVPIIYGLTTFDSYIELQDKVVFGGCVIEDNSPLYQCLDCNATYPAEFLEGQV